MLGALALRKRSFFHGPPTKEDGRDNDNPCTQADRAYPQARVDRGRVDVNRPALNHLITVLRNWSGPASRSR